MLTISIGIFSAMLSAVTAIPWYIPTLFIGSGAAIMAYYFSDSKGFKRLFDGLKFHNANSIYPELIKAVATDYGHDYTFTLPAGMNIKHFENYKMSIEQFLDAKVKFEYKEKSIIMRALERKVSDFYPFKAEKVEPMEIIVGHSAQGLIRIKLKQHTLVCGASGFGKSTFIRAALVTLMKNNKASKLILNLCDFKRTEYGIFKNSKYVNTFAVTKEQLEALLNRLEKEATERYALFDAVQKLDIEGYKALGNKMAYIVNFIDEIAQLEGDKKLMSMLQKRISFDRAAGIFYIICTQRPSTDLIPGSVKANIDTRVCFKTVDSTNSWIVLDDKEAAQYLTVPGRGLIRTAGKDLEEFQAPYISEDEAIELVKHTFRRCNDDNGKGSADNRPLEKGTA